MSTIRLETHRPIPTETATERVGLGQTGPSARVRLGIERNRTTAPELHPERAVSVTRSYRETEGQPLTTRRGRMLLRIVAEHPVKIQEGELIVGMKTLTPRGSPVFPEVSCDWVERDLERLATRSSTPFHVSEPTKQVLRAEVLRKPCMPHRTGLNKVNGPDQPGICLRQHYRVTIRAYQPGRSHPGE